MSWEITMIRAFALIAPLLVAAAPAFAVTTNGYANLNSFSGNDCVSSGPKNNWSGETAFTGVDGGISDGGCALNGSVAIARYDVDSDSFEINRTAFPTVSGKEFSRETTSVGTWTYTPDDAEDPGITAFVAKGGPAYRVYVKNGAASMGMADSAFYSTPINDRNEKPYGLSHLTWFDTKSFDHTTPVPLPAAGWLLLAGVGGLGALRRYARA
jgi:hypothetical protein